MPQDKRGLVARAFVHDAVTCEVVDCQHETERRYPMEKIEPLGLFEIFIPDRDQVFPYRLRVEKSNGEIRQFYDPYSFLPTLGDQDLYLFNEGTEHRVYDKLGAHPRVMGGVPNVRGMPVHGAKDPPAFGLRIFDRCGGGEPAELEHRYTQRDQLSAQQLLDAAG